MSDLGEISAELNEALGRLERLLAQLSELDRNSLGPLQAELSDRPDERQTAALIVRARHLLRLASERTVAARRAGEDWLSRHGSTERRSSYGFDTAGGRAYFPPTEPSLREVAAALPEFPGEYTFDAHGNSEHVFIAGETLSAEEVAELIEADERWGGRPVRLFSCNTGLGEKPIAEQLAKILKVKVTAPEGYAWSLADGSWGVFPIEVKLVQGVVVEVPNTKAEGSWREFYPD